MIKSLYYRLRIFFRKLYLRHKYSGREPKIYYDRRLRGYVHPCHLNDTCFNIELLAEDLANVGLCYDFGDVGKDFHYHEFSSVVEEAYNNDDFHIPMEYEHCYSQQELDLLRAVAKAGKQARFLWRYEE